MFVPDPEQHVDLTQVRIYAVLGSIWGHHIQYSIEATSTQTGETRSQRALSQSAAVEVCLWWLLEGGGSNILLSDTTVADVDRV